MANNLENRSNSSGNETQCQVIIRTTVSHLNYWIAIEQDEISLMVFMMVVIYNDFTPSMIKQLQGFYF